MKQSDENSIKFWTVLAVIILGVAIAVTIIDMSIKASILEESNKLQRLIWGEENKLNGQGATREGNYRVGSDGRIDLDNSADILHSNSAGMEDTNVPNGIPTVAKSTPRKRGNTTMDKSGNKEVPRRD